MNTFNRVVLVILLLVGMVLCSLVLVLPLPTLRLIGYYGGGLTGYFERVNPYVLLPIGILLALIVDLIGILLIILEVRRPAATAISVEQAAGGKVMLSIASISDQLKTEVGQLPDVLQVKPRVAPKGSGVLVELDARIAAEAGVPSKAERIVETVRLVVEQKMGLKLVRPPKVNIEAVRRARPAPVTEKVTFTPPPSVEPAAAADAEQRPS